MRCILFVLLLTKINADCVKNKINLWSPTKCQAGKRFFTRLQPIPNLMPSKIVQPYLHPWLVEIRSYNSAQTKGYTGVLINDRYILSNQNCVPTHVIPGQLKVFFGFFNGYRVDQSELFQSRVLERSVQGIIKHPGYQEQNPATITNNLALLRVNPVKYSKTIFPIQLPSLSDTCKKMITVETQRVLDLTGLNGETASWKFSYHNKQSYSKILEETKSRILPLNYCANFYHLNLRSSSICVLNSDQNHCESESGSAYTLEKNGRFFNVTMLIGMSVQTKLSCQTNKTPEIFARIDNKLKWIKENTPDALYCLY